MAKKEMDLDLTVGDMHDLPYEDGQFDGIVMWDSLEHAVSPYIALCEARRVTRKNGRGLIFIPGDQWRTEQYHIILPTQWQMSHLLWLSGWTLYRMIDLSNGDPKNPQRDMAAYCIVNEGHQRDTKLKYHIVPNSEIIDRIRYAGNLPIP